MKMHALSKKGFGLYLHNILYRIQLVVEHGAWCICLFIHLLMHRYYGGLIMFEYFMAAALCAGLGVFYFKKLKKETEAVLVKCVKTDASWENVADKSGIHVLIWKNDLKGQSRNVGHVALHLSDKTYISRWPDEALQKGSTTKKRTVRGKYITMENDFYLEGGSPTMLINIPDEFLDSLKVKKWFAEISQKEDPEFNLKIKCCSDMVENALTAGELIVFSEMWRYMKFGFNVPDDFGARLLMTLTYRRENLFNKLLYTLKSCSTWHAFSLFAFCCCYMCLLFLTYLSDLVNWGLKVSKAE